MIRIVVGVLLAAAVSLACASTQEPESAPEPVARTSPPPAAPQREAVAETRTSAPAQLPKTASPLPLVGLAGLAALGLGGVTRAVRRRL